MKKLSITAFACLLLTLCLPDKVQSQSFTITNPLDMAREDEIIGIPATELLRAIPAHQVNQAQIREQGQKTYLRTQWIDNELDGQVDELLFQASFGPGETKTFVIEAVENRTAEQQEDTVTTYSRFVPERQNDYAWENDRVAFRAYGLTDTSANAPKPAGGGIDAFFKRVSYPVINKTRKLSRYQ